MSKEAMKLALEALTKNSDRVTEIRAKDQAITALREALAEQQAQQKPVCDKDPQGCWSVRCQLGKKCKNTPAQQEHVAWMELLREARDNCKASIVEAGISASRKEYRIDLEARLTAALNTSPQPEQRKPLTDEQIIGLWQDTKEPDGHRIERFARAIEAKLKENT